MNQPVFHGMSQKRDLLPSFLERSTPDCLNPCCESPFARFQLAETEINKTTPSEHSWFHGAGCFGRVDKLTTVSLKKNLQMGGVRCWCWCSAFQDYGWLFGLWNNQVFRGCIFQTLVSASHQQLNHIFRSGLQLSHCFQHEDQAMDVSVWSRWQIWNVVQVRFFFLNSFGWQRRWLVILLFFNKDCICRTASFNTNRPRRPPILLMEEILHHLGCIKP